MSPHRCRVAAGLTVALLAAAVPAVAAGPPPVRYRLSYRTAGDPEVHVAIALEPALAGVHDLVIPRAIPMGYAVRRYDRYVREVRAFDGDGAAVPVERGEGPRWRVRPAPGRMLARLEYDVDVAAMEREIPAGSDASKLRAGYLGVLGHSVFGYVDGLEGRPVRLEVEAPPGWPVFSTLAPASPVAGPLEASADDFYALADSQVLLGLAVTVERIDGLAVPLFVASYAEAPIDRPRLAAMARRALAELVGYFGGAPFPSYTVVVEVLRPPTPEHEYGFAMEHLQSAVFQVGADKASLAGLSPGADAASAARVEYWIAHHVAHAWIPKRCYGEGYFPHTWEVAPVLDTIWFAEGFGQYAALDAEADARREAERASFLRGGVDRRFGRALAEAPPFLLRMPLVQLSRVASTAYADDFRTGRTVFARGGMMAAELDRLIRERTEGRARLRDALRALVAWSLRQRRGFRIDELPGLIAEATGVDTRAVLERWLGPYAPNGATPAPTPEGR